MSTEPLSTGGTEHFLEEENERLRAELATLRDRLREPEEILRAIRFGEVDGFVVNEGEREAIYQLKSADLLCRSMIEDMHDGAIAIDAAGTLLYCNRRFAGMVGCEREEILGARVQRFLAPETRPRFQELLESRCDDPIGEIELINSNGSHLSAAVSVHPLELEGAAVSAVVLRDLTRDHLQDRLAAESRRKDEFLAILGHELRSPLDPIHNAVHFLRLKGPDLPELHWAREVIERQLRQLTRLVDDLLDLGRIGQGKLELRLEEHTLQDLVRIAVETNRGAIEASEHRLEVSFEDEPLQVQADPVRLTQVISNLLVNAAKFTPPGGRIRVVVERSGDQAILRVADTGVGIPADRLCWIFDLFAQLDSTPDRASGLGIGLALVRRLVEMHGGTVEAASDGPGTGAEFVVRLQLSAAGVANPAGANARPSVVAPPQPEVVRAPRRSRVLLVDDNEDSVDMLAELLKLWGYEVESATDGPTAIAAARAFRPHAVVADLGLPGMDGYELARHLRQLPELAATLLIALTGRGDDEARSASAAAGFDHHTLKPAEVMELRTLLEQRQRSGA